MRFFVLHNSSERSTVAVLKIHSEVVIDHDYAAVAYDNGADCDDDDDVIELVENRLLLQELGNSSDE